MAERGIAADLEADRVAFFKATQEGFERAARQCEILQYDYRIVDSNVRLRFAGPALVPLITPALSHLRTADGSDPDLTINLFDSRSTGTRLPLLVESLVELLRLRWWEHLENRRQIRGYHGDRVQSGFHLGPGILSVFDTASRQAVYWVDDADAIPYYEQGYPLSVILNWWLADLDRYFVHAACVGDDNGGVLITGKGGSGKSSTTLACVGSALGIVGDDYCAIEPYGGAAHSLYNTVKLKGLSDIERFPHLKSCISNLDRVRDDEDGEKAMIFLDQHFPGTMKACLPVRAIMVPRIVGGRATAISPTSAARAFKALTPSTLFQLPGDAPAAFRALSRLVRDTPAWELALGEDLDGIAKAIETFLATGRGVG